MKTPSTNVKHACWVMAALSLLVAGGPTWGQEPPPITAEQFTPLLTLIKPQSGELRFHEIPWLIDVWEARKKAAAEGKPILCWSGAGGAPIGVC